MDLARPPLVHCDPEVLEGAAVFVGSRLPVETLLACIDAGEDWGRVVQSWPWLTEAHLEAARAWVTEHADTRSKP